ncbi:MAG TPA: biotin--[acetyl-CoA-carboxylase] ligase [Candidatus Aminicenantes bacterium]|jgi:BirA family biotin operon repressor/biotin-[acetyl-CoA-carboxylase] ligase|nr:biotin--[acetyl-CoA-carboxylase] ligase [Acidobacteriota bacterium]HNT32775.1 biotin--[acetyl-CoA-carboxylase] ligase [Candidatus Aminicenantes bacterium]HOS10362.1 biotin--[acetyl-CoA-carboxylase] ligase [Candidatus Aminicenantes bacterium]HOU47894.1 biotin--[acetyl-CoA-carboxylase] ligase [Candidatus Aminicenantes bacterium]HPL13182.1 biotin--[acetyl-CoA-carboxylase] ligase [Candidatus Aminicenantes bacterium]
MNDSVCFLDTCVSTNDEARKRAREGAPAGTVVVAREQTGGRGTKGRSWFSPRGAGLYVSVVLRPGTDAALSLLPLAAGLAARRSVERTAGIPAKVRWPNDIVWQGRKLGGILCESGLSGFRSRYAIVGLGLNLSQDESDFPEEWRARAGSLRLAAGRIIDREDVLAAFLEELEGAVAPLFEKRPGDVVDAFLLHAEAGPGEAIRLRTASGDVAGLFEGLDIDGAIRVRTAGGTRRFVSAEIVSFGLDRAPSGESFGV